MHCTLLIELLGTATLETWQSCLWDPFNGNNYPSAIVKGLGSGSFKLIAANADLRESQNPKTNFNPPGDPYDGVSNTTTNDSFAPKLRGLFHIIGSNVQTTLAANLNLDGVVVSEDPVTLGSNVTVTLDPNIFSTPPLGYSAVTGNIEPVAGSWKRESAP